MRSIDYPMLEAAPLAQTGRRPTKADYVFPNEIERGGEELMRGHVIYEYARESAELRAWAKAALKFEKLPQAERCAHQEISRLIEADLLSRRDGWLFNLLVGASRHLALDKPWDDIDAIDPEKTKILVEEAIECFEGRRMLLGHRGDRRKHSDGVRLGWNDGVQPDWSRDDQFRATLLGSRPLRRHSQKEVEVFKIEVSWVGTSTDELMRSFGALVEEMRPEEFPERLAPTRAQKSGVKPSSLRTALRNLGVMRLCHIMNPRDVGDILPKMDPAAQLKARKGARSVFKELFPTLSSREQMRCDQLFLSRQIGS